MGNSNTYIHQKYDKSCPTSIKLHISNILRHTREIIQTEVISLLEFEVWLANRMKEIFNPIVDITASQDSNLKRDS